MAARRPSTKMCTAMTRLPPLGYPAAVAAELVAEVAEEVVVAVAAVGEVEAEAVQTERDLVIVEIIEDSPTTTAKRLVEVPRNLVSSKY